MVIFAVGDGHGDAAAISVAWVGFRTKRDAESFKRLEDVHGNGDVTPLGGSLLRLTGLRFTADHYHSKPTGKMIVVAEAETVTGHLDNATLDAAAEVASYLPRP
jgi:hypothetical protein